MEQIVAVQSQGQKHVWPIYQYTALWQQHTNSALESELKLSHMKDLVPVFSRLEKIHSSTNPVSPENEIGINLAGSFRL